MSDKEVAQKTAQILAQLLNAYRILADQGFLAQIKESASAQTEVAAPTRAALIKSAGDLRDLFSKYLPDAKGLLECPPQVRSFFLRHMFYVPCNTSYARYIADRTAFLGNFSKDEYRELFKHDIALMKDLDESLRLILLETYSLGEIKSIQCAKVLPLGEGRTIRARIVYGPGIDYAYKKSTPMDVLDRINWIAEHTNRPFAQAFLGTTDDIFSAITRAFSSDVFERLMGPSFKSDVILYVVNGLTGAAGMVGAMKKLFKGEQMIEFRPTPTDIRMFIATKTIQQLDVNALAETILHEATHVMDPHLRAMRELKNPGFHDVLLARIRTEGLAVFAEAIEVPNSIDRHRVAILSEIDFDYPLIDSIKAMGGFKDAEYVLGLVMMVQLFLKKEGRLNQISDFEQVKFLLKLHKEDALHLLSQMKKLTHKRFFEYYERTIGEKTIYNRKMSDLFVSDRK